jgi:Zn-finger nucleic acid-binding protein
MNCPRCGHPLRAARADDVELDVCDACHGAWLDHGELCQVLAHAFPGVATAVMDTVLHGAMAAGRTSHPPPRCPRCRTPLHPCSFGSTDLRVELARCSSGHGVWLDGAEVARVRAARARWQQRADEHAAAWRAAATAEARMPETPDHAHPDWLFLWEAVAGFLCRW